MNEQLFGYLNRYEPFTQKEISDILSVMKLKRYKRREFLLRQGKVCPFRYFILEGITRTFHTNDKGIEQTNLFAIENWWVTEYDSYVNQKPSMNSIQAIEAVTVLELPKADEGPLFEKLPKLERVFRIIAEKTLIAQIKKDSLYMKRSSKERYYHLVNSIPNFAKRVPQYMIASYLDITPEYLSEIRKHPI